MNPLAGAVIGEIVKSGIDLATKKKSLKQHVKDTPISSAFGALTGTIGPSIIGMEMYRNPPQDIMQFTIGVLILIANVAVSTGLFVKPRRNNNEA